MRTSSDIKVRKGRIFQKHLNMAVQEPLFIQYSILLKIYPQITTKIKLGLEN